MRPVLPRAAMLAACLLGLSPAARAEDFPPRWRLPTSERLSDQPLRLRDPGLSYIQFEGPTWPYFWSRSARRFLRVWTRN